MNYVTFFVLLSIIKGILSKKILLSQKNGSHDNIACGTEQRPCATFSYALTRLTDGGGILVIDGGYAGVKYKPYLFFPKFIDINGSLTIRKRVNQESPTVIISITDHRKIDLENYYISYIKCLGSLMISSINFQSIFLPPFIHHTSYSIYLFYELIGNIEINDASFEGINAVLITQSDVNDTTTVKIRNTRISFEIYMNKFTTSLAMKIVQVKTLTLYVKDNNVYILNSEVSQGTLIVFGNFEMMNSIFFDIIVIVTGNFLFCPLYSKERSAALIEYWNTSRIEGCAFNNVVFQIRRMNHIAFKNTIFKDSQRYFPVLTIDECNTVTLNDYLFQNISSPFGVPSSLKIRNANFHLYNVTVHGNEKENTIVQIDTNCNSEKVKMTIQKTMIKCAYGQYLYRVLLFSATKVFSLISCTKCPVGTYTLLQGFSTFYEGTNIHCKKCPNAAICNNGTINSKGGYWGYVSGEHNASLEVAFIQCPALFCCSTQETCKSYNTCSPNREGNLCSQCKQGFTCSITNSRICVSNESCGNVLLNITLYLVSVLVYLLFILYIREVMLVFKRLIKKTPQHSPGIMTPDRPSKITTIKEKLMRTLHLKNNTNSEPNLDENEPEITLNERLLPQCFERGDNGHRAVPYQMLLHTNVGTIEYNITSSIIAGSLKVLFFFYQSVTIIRVETTEKYRILLPVFLDSVSSLFNVQPDISYSNFSMCFMQNLENIHVNVVRHAYIVFMAFIVLCMLSLNKVLSFVNNIYKTQNPKTTNSNVTITRIDENVGWYNRLPFDVRLKCAYLQILLIGFAGITTFAFQSVHCVKINKQLYLFIQASISCYQPWQIAMWIFISTCLIPFPFAVYFASKQLYNCSITPSEFLRIITFPPLFLCKLLKKRHHKTIMMKDAMLSKHLLMVLSEPFRQNEDGRGICWESILMLRRTVLLVIHTFIVSPVQKMFPTVFLLLLFIAHNDITRPYKDSVVNTLEKLSLFALISLAVVNFFWAFVNENGRLMASDMYLLLGNSLLYYELVVLSIPIVLLILVAIAFVVKTLVRVCKKCTSKQD